MDNSQKKIVVILFAAVLVFGVSLYDFSGKSKIKKDTPPVAARDLESEDPIVYVSGAVNKPSVFKTCAFLIFAFTTRSLTRIS
jgi:hypothetical protein